MKQFTAKADPCDSGDSKNETSSFRCLRVDTMLSGTVTKDTRTPKSRSLFLFHKQENTNIMSTSRKIYIGKNANEIYTTQYPDIAWIVPGLLPSGMALIGGRPKVGKSWFTMQIAQCMGDKVHLLDQEVMRGKVLYLALEDSERRLKQRMEMQRWSEKSRKNVEFVMLEEFRQKIGFLHINDNAKKLYQLVEKGKYLMTVIDSFNVAFMGLRNVDDNPQVTAAMKPLQQYSGSNNILTYIIDHHNKLSISNGTSQSPIDNIQNSTAKSSISDTALGVYKLEQGRIRLMATGRDFKEVDMKLRTDENMHYQLDGHGKLTDKEEDVFDVLAQSHAEMKLAEIADILNIPKSRASERIMKLMDAGLIDKSKYGVYFAKNNRKH